MIHVAKKRVPITVLEIPYKGIRRKRDFIAVREPVYC